VKVALVHDWLTGMRGGEKVLEVFCEIFPQADIFTLLYVPGSVSDIIADRKIKTSFIQKLPAAKKRYRTMLPLFPMAVESLNLHGYDLVVSSSHCVAKGVMTAPKTLHISYIHTPMRYIWDMYHEYFGEKRGLKGKAISIFAHYLRMWDASTSGRVDYFISNSRHVARRVEKYYGRPSTVICPPVECGRFRILPSPKDYYLIVSAFAPYKRIDLAIEAFNFLGLRLKVIGTGPEEKKLRKMARGNVEFLGWKTDSEIADYYAGCRALIFPGEEDFGIVPLEAMASGRPVIAYGKGGALETVLPLTDAPGIGGYSPTGIFFYEQTRQALVDAVREFEKSMSAFDPVSIRRHAESFDRTLFKEKVREYVLEKYDNFLRGCDAQKTQ